MSCSSSIIIKGNQLQNGDIRRTTSKSEEGEMVEKDNIAANRTYDLIIRNVLIEGIEDHVDIGIAAGRVVTIAPNLSTKGVDEFDGRGCLASPPFVDPHTHLDRAFMKPSENTSGTLEEAIEIMRTHKSVVFKQTFDARVDTALELMLEHGTLAVRTHIDAGSVTGISSVEAMIAVRERWADLVYLQIVAFPPDGLINDQDAPKFVRKAMEMGADLVGGIPAIEVSPKAAQEHINTVFELAVEFDSSIDMHIDETDDPGSRTLEMLADATMDAGWQGRVAAVHCCALAAYDDVYAGHVIEKVAEAGIHVIANAPINLMLQGRRDKEPKRRGITRVKELLDAGVNVSCGHDNLQDVFYPFGKGDMLEVAFVTALASHMSGEDEIETVFDFPRSRAALILELEEYGLEEGGPADLVLLPVRSAREALAMKPHRYAVFRDGNLLVQSDKSTVFHVVPSPSEKV
jgi:cytosine deaminase